MIDIDTLQDAVLFTIIDKVEERLLAIEGVKSVELMPDGEPNQFRALEIYPHTKPIIEGEVGSTRHQLGMTVEGYVQGGSGKEALADLAKLYAGVVTSLFTEPVLDGLAHEITEGALRLTTAKFANKKRLGFALDLDIEFATDRDDPTIAA